jgi:peptide-methionine (S)-S-oxide reductase
MFRHILKFHPRRAFAAVGLLAVAALILSSPRTAAEGMKVLPPPAIDEAPARTSSAVAVFAGGCFWGVQGVFQHVKGVTRAVSGYQGGAIANPTYEQVSGGTTGHAESVSVTFDPSQVSYGALLRIFFSVALDPTQVDRQGPDSGTQYRSMLFVNGPEQEKVARAYIAQLDAARTFSRPIATRVEAGGTFWPAEAYHQDYLEHHPDAPYIAFHDMPKIRALQSLFPAHWRDQATMTLTAATRR